jgi:hypothetical protein
MPSRYAGAGDMIAGQMTGQGHSATQPSPSSEPTAPAGWYPDPLSAAEQRYWDGERWTNHIHGGKTDPVMAMLGRDRSKTLIALGGLALGISPFLTWVNVVLLGSLNLFQLTQAAGHRSGMAWAAVLIGGASAFGAWTANSHTRARLIGVVVGSLVGAVAILVLIGMVHDVRQSAGLVHVSYGPWVAILGCLAMVVGGLMRPKLESTPARL